MDLQDKSNIDNLYKAYNTLVEQMVNAGVAEDSRFVDLGLPSGVLWSNYNLGSDSIEDPGLYFQWGDTEGFYYKDGKVLDQYGNESDKVFDYKHYKWFNGTDAYKNGTHEGLIEYYILEDEDGEYIYKQSNLKDKDNAVIQYNSKLSLPSSKQIKELLQGTNRSFVMIGDQKLICFESVYNNNKLYIPVVQNIGDTSMGQVECCFWVSWINQQNQAFCPVYSFYEGGPTNSAVNYDVDRSNGLPLRPVKSN